LPVPFRRPLALIVRCDAVVRQTRLPRVGQDYRPEEPKPILGIDEHGRVAVRKAGSVGHQKRLAPAVASFPKSRSEDGDIVGAAFALAPIPGGQQIAVGAFDDAGGMVMLGM